ncbi:MAG: hypothetical protein UT48_C0008G0020 [Parcubacteria group bacterium GW2011_GWE2_39_37]|uniref:POTRA domain-containing protein n=1 Tax=Candidatus Falkowbacteria bacterium GW2011_GWF2_39_8 TaxID=1618642 RepID=A0A0G0Q1Y3_9BACT|nr:MAG: hypothetical protein UT48_C0008G0020 [Parcubacteria group bacterium GW2011_GWE2_39_37]KKR31376.1 MAG: hypothetical protein UT64_C0062G0007 [Candidatus Falkowbacteria bacterium GW2011_GWF2_39_8]
MYNRRRKPKKMDYSKKKYSNPFFRGQKTIRKFPTNNYYLTWKQKLIILIFILLIPATIWLFFYFKFFDIKHINITGSEKISKDEVINMAWQQANKKRYLLGSQKNIFLFDEVGFSNTLQAAYPLGVHTMEKKLPGTLKIDLKEKHYSAIWNEGEKYYFLSDDKSVTEVEPLQIKDKALPIIQNIGEPKIYNSVVIEQDEKIACALAIFQKLKTSQHNFEIEKFIIEKDEYNSLKVALKGPTLIFNLKDDIDKQINKLYAIINDKLKADYIKKNYIDLRFGDKIYYQ